MGATAFQKGLGAIHALSHPIGSLFDSHHGLTNAVVMPYVLAFNRPAIEDRIERLARYAGIDEPSFDGFMRWVLELRREIGIPHTIDALGVAAKDLDRLSDMAAVDPCAGGNPVAVGAPELKQIYVAALEGRVA
jgi:alcohol dehydrogenase class IV